MAKKNKDTEVEIDDKFFKDLAKEVDGETLEDLATCPGFIDTGVLALNYCISGKFVGGGFPVGSLSEVMGPESVGKSLLGANFLKGVQKANGVACFHDAEHAISKDFAIKAARVNPKRLVVTKSDTLEGSFNRIHKTIRQVRDEAGIPLERFIGVVYDSIAVSSSEREFVETRFDMDEVSEAALKAAGGGAEKPGERARICGRELRKLMPIAKNTNSHVFFVNQYRKTIGGMSYDNNTTAGGGEALKYYCSTRIKMSASKVIKNEDGKVIGNNITFKCIKSRFTSPFKEARVVKLFYENGIDPFSGLLELLMLEGRLESPSAGNYVVRDKYSDGKKIKFKSSKERNDIPLDVLMECPLLVDAQSPKEIEYYVEMFGSAMEMSHNENLKEEDVKNIEE